jgi:hypothetical protein
VGGGGREVETVVKTGNIMLESFWGSVEEDPFATFLSYIHTEIDSIESFQKHSLLKSLSEIDNPTPQNLQKLENIMREANSLQKKLASSK